MRLGKQCHVHTITGLIKLEYPSTDYSKYSFKNVKPFYFMFMAHKQTNKIHCRRKNIRKKFRRGKIINLLRCDCTF